MQSRNCRLYRITINTGATTFGECSSLALAMLVVIEKRDCGKIYLTRGKGVIHFRPRKEGVGYVLDITLRGSQ
jgi:hypothetical protein